ncbi:MAG: protein kinase domain-containing protein [Thermomicrobiales bacterium]
MSDLIGEMIGNYRVEALLGTGGMATVFRGTHMLLNRPVAIKVPHPQFTAEPGFNERFAHEAKAVAGLDHPNIVSIFDFGKRDDGLHYLVMELISAGSIRRLLQQWGSNPDQRSLAIGIDLMCQATSALNYAHHRGIIHRDIKPDNMLLRAQEPGSGNDRSETLNLTDFGLARLAQDAFSTASGQLLGTPTYMSPEQFQGADPDERSDIYSLGVVLYEVATGYLPFEIKTLSDAAYKHTSVEPPLPLMVRPDLPPQLGNIILRCLDKRPQNRFASAGELLTALQTVLLNLRPLPGMASGTFSTPYVEERRPPVPQQSYTSALVAPPAPPSMPPGWSVPPQTSSPPGWSVPPQPRLTPGWNAPPQQSMPPAQPMYAGGSRAPRLSVLDQTGQVYQSLEVTGRGLTIGSGNDNDVVLSGVEVSHHHLRMDWDGQRVAVTDLGSTYGTIYRDIPLAPFTPQPWQPGDAIKVSAYWLRLETPALETMVLPTDGTINGFGPMPQPEQYQPPAPVQSRIRIVLTEGAQLSIVPGQSGTVKGTLANLGTTVDHFRLSIEGMPRGWLSGTDQEIQLNPGMSAPIELTVRTQRSPAWFAGEYPVTIIARSRERPQEIGTADALFTILPFTESALTLEPNRVRGRRKAAYTVTLRNDGNIAGRYSLNGEDDEKQLAYRFTPQTIDLDPGTYTSVRLSVTGARNVFGRPLSRYFNVAATSAAVNAAPPARGEWSQPAILPPWTVFIPVFLVAGLLLLWQLNGPSIESVTIQPQQPVAGQPVILTWKVHHTSSIDIQPLLKGLDPSTGNHVFPKGLPNGSSLTLVAHGFLKTTEKQIPISVAQATPVPTVEPIAPDVSVWEVTPQTVKPGDSVTIRWKVGNAESVELLSSTGMDETVELEGQRTIRVTETTTFSLNATNHGKTTKRSQAVAIQAASTPAGAPAASRPAGIPIFTATPAPGAPPGAVSTPVSTPPPRTGTIPPLG